MGDGEQGEGSIYEAAMAGNQYKLDNLVAIIDRNRLQISGTTEEVMSLESMRDRWTAFGWDVLEMNGDEMEDIIRTFRSIDYTNKKASFAYLPYYKRKRSVLYGRHCKMASWRAYSRTI